MRQEISNSELCTFRTCRKKHSFEYLALLRPKLPARVLTWGNTIHAGLEAGYLGAFGPALEHPEGRLGMATAAGCSGVRAYHAAYLVKLDEATRDGMPDEVAQERFEDAAKMLTVALWAVPHFFEATQRDLETLVPLGFEVPFRVPVPDKRGHPTGLKLKGKIDGIWWDPENHQVIVDDHKTVDELVGTTEKRIALDPQMSGYMHAVRHLMRTGKMGPLDGSLLPDGAAELIGRCRYNVIRRSGPKQPGVNKVAKNDGPVQAVGRDPWPEATLALKAREEETGEQHGLVSTKTIDTTAAIFAAALAAQMERGLPINEKQQEILDRLQRQGDRYFARFEFWRGSNQLEQWRQELWVEARLMREAERLPVLQTRNPGACTTAASMPCAYRAVCLDDEPETRALYRVAAMKHEEVGL